MTDKFTTITSLLSEAHPDDLLSMTFDALCRRYGACPLRLNNLFYDNFGMCGDDVIARVTRSRRKISG